MTATTIPASAQDAIRAFLQHPTRLYIDGHWQAASGGGLLEVLEPCEGTLLGHAAAGGAADIDAAVQAARRAFDHGPWRTTTPAQRARLLWQLAEQLEAHGDTLALLETLNNGIPFRVARHMNVGLAAECLRYNAGWATKLSGDTLALSQPGEWHAYTLREPIGVVGQIVPWNVPLPMAVAKIAPALAAGCTVVLKPAELTPFSAVMLMQLVAAVGFPPGVVNLVTGTGTAAGAALVAHPDVDKVSFTGSTAVGKQIVRSAADSMKRVSLELGGKSPVFIFADADLEPAMNAAAMGIFANSGQVCAAGSRLYVERSVYDQVLAGVTQRARQLRVGPGTAAQSEMGPLISAAQRERVLNYIASGVADGAEVVAGGGALEGPGYFVAPTVLAQTRHDMRVVRDEIFGPVLCAMPFDHHDLDALAALANDTHYGLSASIWTRDGSQAHRLARRIRSGNVRINTPTALDAALPFGGARQSGWGRENGRSGVELYTELKSVAMKL